MSTLTIQAEMQFQDTRTHTHTRARGGGGDHQKPRKKVRGGSRNGEGRNMASDAVG